MKLTAGQSRYALPPFGLLENVWVAVGADGRASGCTPSELSSVVWFSPLRLPPDRLRELAAARTERQQAYFRELAFYAVLDQALLLEPPPSGDGHLRVRYYPPVQEV